RYVHMQRADEQAQLAPLDLPHQRGQHLVDRVALQVRAGVVRRANPHTVGILAQSGQVQPGEVGGAEDDVKLLAARMKLLGEGGDRKSTRLNSSHVKSRMPSS